ncbi:hypothetical protein HPB50_000522 [Hyalomma asiaticum]|uniref:Uncharacterized protein n=1 Tax=Hyalomma asiaticum TaxID=266040 RepID=A0ACB7SZW4_HYAAI|nr:hypothetical protein HPB50_000522 [Hyalomma asiaticum]
MYGHGAVLAVYGYPEAVARIASALCSSCKRRKQTPSFEMARDGWTLRTELNPVPYPGQRPAATLNPICPAAPTARKVMDGGGFFRRSPSLLPTRALLCEESSAEGSCGCSMSSPHQGSIPGGHFRAVPLWNAEGPNPTTVVASAFVVSCATFGLAAVLLNSWEHGWRSTDPLCTTEDCREHAQRLSRGLDRKASPCGDLQRFTCGSWSYDAHVPLVKNVAQAAERSWFGRIADPAFLEPRRKPALAAKTIDEYESNHTEGSSQGRFFCVLTQFLDDNAFVWHRLSENASTVRTVSAIERLVVFAVRWRLPTWLDVHLTPAT